MFHTRVSVFKERLGSCRVKNVTSESDLSNLLVQRKWSEIINVIARNPDALTASDFEESLFHKICRFQPPLEVIEFIVNISRKIASIKNNFEQFPLHVAAQNGALPEVIGYLCKLNPKASGSQDRKGKTPLHLASESYMKKYTHAKKRKIPAEEAYFLTTKILVRSSPNTVNIEDHEGMSALEYALDNNVALKVIRVLQKASEKEWKKKVKLEKHIGASERVYTNPV